MNIQTVLTPWQTSSKAVMAAFVFAPQRALICDLTLGASGPHTVGRSAGASSVLDVSVRSESRVRSDSFTSRLRADMLVVLRQRAVPKP